MKKEILEFPIKKYDPIIVRDNSEEKWMPAIFNRLDPHDFYKNYMDAWFGEEIWGFKNVAPLKGNERCIGTIEEPFDLWDKERLEKEGFV
jgi:hypothetical protein